MVVVTDAEADETRKHPLPERLNLQQSGITCDSEQLAALEGWKKAKDIKKGGHRC